MENFSTLTTGGKAEVDLVADGWTEIIGKLARRRLDDGSDLAKALEIADFEKMEQVRRRAEEIVNDPNVAEALKPYYRQFCKRPCFHDEYLQTYNRPNVTLVDTQGRGVEAVTERGIVANGVEYEVDCIIYASGFEVGTPLERRAGYQVYGRGGQALSDKWRDGVSTLFGMQTRSFPNCFIVSQSQAGTSANIPHMLDVESRHISYIIQYAREHEVLEVDVSEEAEAAWVQTVIDASLSNIGFLEACTPGYYNNEGQPNGPLLRRNGTYVPGVMRFSRKLDEWRSEGSLPGLEFRHG
jgi:cyclohexanone monooxygenase